MEKRRLIRLEIGDFLEIRPLNEAARKVKGLTKNLSLMGICFSSDVQWKKGQVLMIDYFISEELDSIKLKIMVVWSELIDKDQGYFCGGQILNVEDKKQEKFANYYFQKLKERSLETE